MSFLLDELWRNALCAVLFPLMLASIGAPIARLAPLNFTRPLSLIELICQYMLYGLAIAPPVLDIAGRIGGPQAITLTAAGLSLLGLIWLVPAVRRDSAQVIKAGAPLLIFFAWYLYIHIVKIPVIIDHTITVSLIDYDHMKHNMVTNAIAFGGTPPPNVFFYSPGDHITYYYFFHIITACLINLTGGIVEARHAMTAACIWMMPLLLTLITILYEKILIREINTSTFARQKWIVLLICVTGLNFIGGFRNLSQRG